MLDLSYISQEESYRVLDFLNRVKTVEELMDPSILKDDPHSGYGDQIDDIRIGSLVAMRIMAKRENCPNKVFTHLNQLDDIPGFGQDKLNDLVYSLKPKSKKPSFQNTTKSRGIMPPSGGENITIKAEDPPIDSPAEENGSFKLEDKDIGNLEKVLRTYYLSQIKSLDGRKNRKLARELIEDHLVLPESQQRTSKDLAYIKEKLQIEGFLLKRLEDTRLIRKISRRGNNPIFEVSHDSLVEPILKERRRKEAIAAFWKNKGWALLFLLPLFFLFGWCSKPGPEFQDEISLSELAFNWESWKKDDHLIIEVPELFKNNLIFAERLTLPLDVTPPFPQNTRSFEVNIGKLTDEINISIPELSTSSSRTYAIADKVPFSLKRGQEYEDLTANINGEVKVTINGNQRSSTPTINDTLILNLENQQLKVDGRGQNNRSKSISVPLSRYIADNPENELLKSLLNGREIMLKYKVSASTPRVTAFNGDITMGGIPYVRPNGAPLLYTFSSGGGSRSAGSTSTYRLGASSHIVRAGETLFSIAQGYGLTVAQLKALNNLSSNTISQGQSLRLK